MLQNGTCAVKDWRSQWISRRSVRSKALRFFSAVVNICTSADVSSISSLKALWCLWDAPGAASLLSAAGRHQGQVAHSRCLLPSTLWQGIKYVKSFGPTSLSGANAEAGMKKGGNNSLFFCNLVKQLLHQMQDKWSSHRGCVTFHWDGETRT